MLSNHRFTQQVLKFLPDLVIAMLDDLGDIAEEEAERRNLIEVELERDPWTIDQIAVVLNALDDEALHWILAEMGGDGRQRVSQIDF